MLRGVYPEIAEGLSMTQQQTRKARRIFFLCVLCILGGNFPMPDSLYFVTFAFSVVNFSLIAHPR